MKKLVLYFSSLLVVPALFLGLACGGGGGSSAKITLGDLQGEWTGLTGSDGICDMTVDGSGNLTDLSMTQPDSYNFSGSIAQSGESTFVMTLAEAGAPSVFYTGTFVAGDSEHGFAQIWVSGTGLLGCVLQKGPASIPLYTEADLLGSWSGPSCLYSTTTAQWHQANISDMAASYDMTVNITMTDAMGDTLTGMVMHNPMGAGNGVYISNVSSVASTSMLASLMTPDKKGFGVQILSMDSFPPVPEDFQIMMLMKE